MINILHSLCVLCLCLTLASARLITFSNRTWYVKSHDAQPFGPGMNYWSSSNRDVWCDTEDELHMRVRRDQNRVWCSEVILTTPFINYQMAPFTYGVNILYERKPNLVIGAFLYSYDEPDCSVGIELHAKEIIHEFVPYYSVSDELLSKHASSSYVSVQHYLSIDTRRNIKMTTTMSNAFTNELIASITRAYTCTNCAACTLRRAQFHVNYWVLDKDDLLDSKFMSSSIVVRRFELNSSNVPPPPTSRDTGFDSSSSGSSSADYVEPLPTTEPPIESTANSKPSEPDVTKLTGTGEFSESSSGMSYTTFSFDLIKSKPPCYILRAPLNVNSISFYTTDSVYVITGALTDNLWTYTIQRSVLDAPIEFAICGCGDLYDLKVDDVSREFARYISTDCTMELCDDFPKNTFMCNDTSDRILINIFYSKCGNNTLIPCIDKTDTDPVNPVNPVNSVNSSFPWVIVIVIIVIVLVCALVGVGTYVYMARARKRAEADAAAAEIVTKELKEIKTGGTAADSEEAEAQHRAEYFDKFQNIIPPPTQPFAMTSEPCTPITPVTDTPCAPSSLPPTAHLHASPMPSPWQADQPIECAHDSTQTDAPASMRDACTSTMAANVRGVGISIGTDTSGGGFLSPKSANSADSLMNNRASAASRSPLSPLSQIKSPPKTPKSPAPHYDSTSVPASHRRGG